MISILEFFVDIINFAPLSGRTLEESLEIYAVAAGIVAILLFLLVLFLLVATRKRAGEIAGRMTEGLLSSRELFLKLYENSPVPYLLVSGKGTITFPNAAAIRLFGIGKRELEGKDLFESITMDDKEHFNVLPAKFRQGSPISNEEVQIKRTDQKNQWALLSIFPFESSKGKHNGLVTLVDITKQKEIDRAKSEFVSLASHQLRTPISSMQWNIELLMKSKTGELSQEQQEYAEKVMTGAHRLKNIVDDFLSVSKLELGSLEPTIESVNITELLENVLEEFEERVEKKELKLHVDCMRNLSVSTDARLFRMVLQNLVSNAIKYTPEGGSVSVTCGNVSGDLEIQVADTGLGIPEEDQAKLFTKLFRAHNVREQVPDGTGLGLYIVSLILRSLGGRISFTSEEGKGTTFVVRLPV